ncbi:hypothetical protein HJC23_004898 [Cyclotella cryptica]|uniref:Uncharacterized protein n=1 Tax=Cyclotella cryptica TaxID=29204 RepID=A0ABD3P3U3_9STRA
MLKLEALPIFLCLLSAPAGAYVTTGLPAHTHRAFLRKLTDDICNTSPGSLSIETVNHTAPMLMSAWAEAPEKLHLSAPAQFSGKERAMAVEGLLKRMIDERRAGNAAAIVKTQDYNAVMKSWAMSGEQSAAAVRVEEILTKMQDMYEAGDNDVQPDLVSFQIAIEAWTKASDDENAPRRAHRILEWMCGLHLSSKNDLAAPDTSCFHMVLKSWAGSRKLESPIMAEHLIMWMQHLQSIGLDSVKPDTMCFNIVMSAWLKSGDIAAEKRIREIFEYMDRASRNGHKHFKPDAGTYNIVISSISPAVKKYFDSCAARRADKILARLEKGFLAGDESLRPDTIIYNQVIDYWAKTQSVRGYFLKARDVLDRQIAMHASGVRRCKPDVMSYTAVIAACASTYGTWDEKKRAFELAHKTFMECCEHSEPNDVTYGIMFKAVSRLLQSRAERDRYSRTLFSLTCEDGFLGEMAFSRFEEAVSKEVFKELTNGVSCYGELPREWKRNAHQKSSSKKTSKKEETVTIRMNPALKSHTSQHASP